MIECGEEGEQDAGIHNSLTQVGGNDVCVVLPFRVLEPQKRNQQVSNAHQSCTSPNEMGKFPPSRHHDAGDEPAQWSCERWDGKTSASLGGAVQKNDLEEQRKCEEKLYVLDQYPLSVTVDREKFLTAYAAMPTQTLAI